MSSGENKRFHLKLIEDTINRLASNSFLIKGWSLTVIGGLLAIYISNSSKKWSSILLMISVFLVIMFWASDAYYLRLERSYRSLYSEVRKKNEEEIDFSLDTTKCRDSFWSSFFSIHLFLIYLVMIFAVAFFCFCH